MKVSIIAICYNAYSDTIELLDSINKSKEEVDFLDLKVIVCDNSNENYQISKLEDLNKLKSKIDVLNYNYIKLDNVGYFPAFSIGKDYIDDVSSCVDWNYVIVTNVDLQFDKMFFKNLVDFDLPSDVGIVAPSIISKQTKEDINPKIMVRPKKIKLLSLYYGFQFLLFYRLYNWLSVSKAKLKGYKQKKSFKKPYATGKEMYAAHGSVMIFTKNYFNLGASIYYPRFLFGEEVFVAEEARLKGLKTIYSSELKIYDNEHGSTSREADRFISKEHVKSYKYLLQNYFSLR